MITIRFSGRTPSPLESEIGMETDQRAERMRFLLPQVADDQTAQLMMILPDGTPDAMQIRDGMVVIPASVTATPGRIRAWVEILGGDTVAWNSEIFYLTVGDLPPISERTEQQYPTAIQEALAACARVEGFMTAAEESARLIMACNGVVSVTVEGGEVVVERLPLDDGDAYAVAVANGYTGTEEEFNTEIAAIIANQSRILAAETKAQEAKDLAAEAKAEAQATAALTPRTAAATVAAADWETENEVHTAEVACAFATADNVLIVGIAGTATEAQYMAMADARIVCSGQAEGAVTLTAYGLKPTIDLPISIVGVRS